MKSANVRIFVPTLRADFFKDVYVEIVGRKKREESFELTKKTRRQFKITALEALTKRSIDPKRFEVHHVIPMGLGGADKRSNLAVVEKDLHLRIHKYIQAQLTGWKKGDRGVIKIPIYRGIVWGSPS